MLMDYLLGGNKFPKLLIVGSKENVKETIRLKKIRDHKVWKRSG